MSKNADKRGKVGERSQLIKQGNNKSLSKTKKRSRTQSSDSKATKSVMEWSVEYADSFGEWWDTLCEDEQVDITAVVGLLEKMGSILPFPYSSGVNGSKYSHMRELRIQHAGRPYRVLYAFNQRRTAILLVGGDKTGDDRWYTTHVPIADAQYGEHLRTLK